MADQFIAIRNFEKFQHYHDRRPPWIKLYRDLFDDPRFFDLSDTDRYHLIGLFVIASQHENRLPLKVKWLQSQLRTMKPINMKTFIDTGWIELLEQDASTLQHADDVLAPRYPSRAGGETETETDPRKAPAADDDGFDEFWKRYPKKVGKLDARKAWAQIHPVNGLREKIADAIDVAKRSEQWRKNHGQFIPNPATWLHRGQWDDQPIETLIPAERKVVY